MNGVPGAPDRRPLEWWYAWFGPYVGDALLVLAALPLAGLMVWALADHRRRRGVASSTAWGHSLAEVGILYGTVPFVALTLMPGSHAGESAGSVSLVPLRDLATMPTYQIVGNLLVFAAFGFLAPLRFRAMASLWRVVLVAGLGSTLIETAQHVLVLDRVSSIDDIGLNTAGAGMAAVVALVIRGGHQLIRPVPHRGPPLIRPGN